MMSTRKLPKIAAKQPRVVIVGINRGLASSEFHYGGKNNHFWRLLHSSGITSQLLNPHEEDLLFSDYRIKLTNMVDRITRSSADLKRAEIVAGGAILLDKLREWQPAIIVFNGKSTFETAFKRKVDQLGLQDSLVGIEAQVFVVPSSSARVSHYQFEDKLELWKEISNVLDNSNFK